MAFEDKKSFDRERNLRVLVTVRSFYDKLLQVSNILVLLGAIVILIAVSMEFFQNILLTKPTVMYLKVQFWVCMLFLFDYILRFIAAKKKLRFFFRNMLILLISIPVFNIVIQYGANLSHEWYVLLHILPVVRGGYAISLIVRRLTGSSLSELLVSYLTFVIMLTYFSSMIFYYVENGNNSMVVTFLDALWWASMNLTTVGSNIYATTYLGKFLSALLAGTGMMIFPIFTVYITNVFENRYNAKKNRKKVVKRE